MSDPKSGFTPRIILLGGESPQIPTPPRVQAASVHPHTQEVPMQPNRQWPVKALIAGAVAVLFLEVALASAVFAWIETQKYMASLPPDLYKIDDPVSEIAGESLGWSRSISLSDEGKWNTRADLLESRAVYVVEVAGVREHRLVSWTQQADEDIERTVLGESWTWLHTMEDRKGWPLPNDLGICEAGTLLAWSKADSADGLVTVARTALDGKTESSIESVKGGTYWCVFETGEGDKSTHRLETRTFGPPVPGTSLPIIGEDGAEQGEVALVHNIYQKVVVADFRYNLARNNP